MPKYIKYNRVKKPIENRFDNKDARYPKNSSYSDNKSNHIHFYEPCIIRERNREYTFLQLGQKCKYCKKIIPGKMILSNDIPEEYKELHIVEKGE